MKGLFVLFLFFFTAYNFQNTIPFKEDKVFLIYSTKEECRYVIHSKTKELVSSTPLENEKFWSPLWWRKAICHCKYNETGTPNLRLIAFAFAWFWIIGLIYSLYSYFTFDESVSEETLKGFAIFPGLLIIGLGIIVLIINAILGLITYAYTGETGYFIDSYFLFFILLSLCIAGPALYLIYYISNNLIKSNSALRIDGSKLKTRFVGVFVICLDLLGMLMTIKSLYELF